jgi:hypothetical protein
MYTNYQVRSLHKADTNSNYNDDSIYSTTPFGAGSSFFSPSVTAQQKMTPCENNVHFEFPPELRSSSSSESSSSDELQSVPFVAQRTSPKAASSQISPMSTTSLSTTLSASRVQVPRSTNPYGADSIHPKKNTMKKQRKRRTAAGTVGGMVLGGLVLGPAGVVAGAAAGGVAANRICKARERRAQRKYEQANFQKAADRSDVHNGAFA